jgi:hypothetical protein
MAEAESAFARFLRLFFIKLFTSWWGTLDDAAKSNVEVGGAVLLAIGLVIFVLVKLPKRQLAIQIQSPNPIIDPAPNPQIASAPTQPLQEQLSAYWTVLGGEIRVGGLLCVAFLTLAAFGSWPYNFYILTRIVVCFCFVCFAVLLHRFQRFAWEGAIAFWALLFNPIAPFRFPKDTWQLFNIAALITLISALFIYARIQVEVKRVSAAPLGAKTLEATPALKSEMKMKSRAYRYCGSCSIRVGQSDTFCKRCGETLG